MKKKLAVLIFAALLITSALSGCSGQDTQEVTVIPADQVQITGTSAPEGDDAADGDIAMDINKLEAGNLFNGGVCYASYEDSYFFNYYFEEGNQKNGLATLYVKDTFGTILPHGNVTISFDAPNYPRGLFRLDDTVYYIIPGGTGSGIYQIKSDGTDNRIVMQTPSDLFISQVYYSREAIYYILSSDSTEPDERAGLYSIDMTTQAQQEAKRTDIKADNFTVDTDKNIYYPNPDVNGEIIVADPSLNEISKIKISIDTKITNLSVYDNFIYFYAPEEKNLYRAPSEGGTQQLLAENYQISSFLVVEDQLFFAGTDDAESKGYQLHSMNIDGSAHTVICIEPTDCLMSDGEWINCYVLNGDEYVESYRIRTNGSSYESSAIVG